MGRILSSELEVQLKNVIKKLASSSKDILSHEQKKYLKQKLSVKQKAFLDKLLNLNQSSTQKRIDQQKRLLLNLGFNEQGYSDFKNMTEDSTDPELQQAAAWELAVYHANQNTLDDAKKCLDLLSIVKKNDENMTKDFLNQIAVIEAECQELLGNVDIAKEIISNALVHGENPDLFLAYANLEVSQVNQIEWINKALQRFYIEPISIEANPILPLYDSITAENKAREIDVSKPKVTVIMPVYNSENVIKTALTSVINQTWTNLEIIVADDCSNDRTIEIIKEYQEKDSRIHLIQAKSNGGPYVARNLALQIATGEFITCHDADDWSHPQKIEKQVLHLMENNSVMGNTSQQARATDNMKFFRRGKPGFYIFSNMSSFLFRRDKVLEKLGFWDSVRFGADSEFIRRVKKVFGEKSVVNLSTGPLSFQRHSDNSLTSNNAFGYHGFFMGARKEYFESFEYYHKTYGEFYYDFPQKSRPFQIPEPMKPNREKKPSEIRQFDVIIASDFRLDGGSNLSNIEEIKAQKKMGLRTGLIQMARYDYNVNKKINPKVRELLCDDVQMIVYGEKVSCDVLIVRYPPILQEKQRFIPDVQAKKIHVIINQTPMSDYGTEGTQRYDIKQSQQNLESYFGEKGIWHPIGPLVRETLYKYHSEDVSAIHLAKEDWVNIINIDDWNPREDKVVGDIPIIGRHSRDAEVKWPADAKSLTSIYPDSNKYKVHILGGAQSAKKVLGYIPKNWHVYDFGELEPKIFLANLDVYVYFTHLDWVESFGRVIIEAMAVGVPVILPHRYQDLFGDAAIYAEPHEVTDIVDNICADPSLYKDQVKRAYNYLDHHFGYSKHASRLREGISYEK